MARKLTESLGGRVEPTKRVNSGIFSSGTATSGVTRSTAVIARGGTSPGSVSKKTFCLVVGAAPGASKVTKAGDLGIPIVPQEKFQELLTTGEIPA